MSRDDLDNLEFAVTQYLVGTLPPLERAALEQRLTSDPEAQRLLAEHRKLDVLLGSLPPLPTIKWEALHQHLATRLDQEEAPIRHYSIAFVRNVQRLALAACVLIAAALALSIYRTGTPITSPTAYAQVIGPAIERPAGPAVAKIQIGPSALASADEEQVYSDLVIARPSQVVIASGDSSAQDNDSLY